MAKGHLVIDIPPIKSSNIPIFVRLDLNMTLPVSSSYRSFSIVLSRAALCRHHYLFMGRVKQLPSSLLLVEILSRRDVAGQCAERLTL